MHVNGFDGARYQTVDYAETCEGSYAA
jgi:hypothetical protein